MTTSFHLRREEEVTTCVSHEETRTHRERDLEFINYSELFVTVER